MYFSAYSRSIIIALVDLDARTTDEIIAALKEMGWTGKALIPEVVERAIQSMKQGEILQSPTENRKEAL